MITIGQWQIDNPTALAPMAGVSDLPFRRICKQLGAGFVVSEMVTSDSRLWDSQKSHFRLQRDLTSGPHAVQIAGSEPKQLATAAQLNVDLGADIIDINMGCPAKKVCKKAAGSALLKDELLVAQILTAVTAAVDVPVTLKFRTGWSQSCKNGVRIARIAEDCGIQGLAVHGRTRECRFKGDAEYDVIADIVSRVNLPVWANGDIDSPQKAAAVIKHTKAAGVMIGRAAQGNPWIFQQINHYFETGELMPPPSTNEIRVTLLEHLYALHEFYGEGRGVRIARKHLGWYTATLPIAHTLKNEFNTLATAQQQYKCIQQQFERLAIREEHAA